MNAPSAQALLRSWEIGHAAGPVRRALAMLQAGWPERPAAEWSRLPIGERDAWLLGLHEALFGTRLETLTPCPACGEQLEAGFETSDLRAGLPTPGEAPADTPTAWQAGAYRISYHAPNSDDLLQVLADDLPAEAAPQHLLARCIEAASRDGAPIAATDLPAEVAAGLQQQMAARDPGADIQISLRCAACDHAFDRRFDIASYLWSELDDWAQRTLAEVHTLAGAYGWSEQAILELSAARRGHYIGLVSA
ncbi:MAG TPA: hypothetical protein VLA16_01945 [Ideonella sp.]|nr:hypothetical protein [Ideonella sp.]